jgi:very-short-patch-repair endonuclease
MDVVAQFDRDIYLYERGWKVLHIPAIWLWNNPNKVQQQVLGFLLYGKVR